MDNNLLIVLGFCRWVVNEDWWWVKVKRSGRGMELLRC